MKNIVVPPANWSIAKKLQFYLNLMGFETGGIDGLFGVKSSSGLILLQYYLNECNITGKVNAESYKLAKTAYENGITHDFLRTININWRVAKPCIDTSHQQNNGHISTADMVRIPTPSCSDAFLAKDAAIAWAMLVNAAMEFNKISGNSDRIETSKFAAAGVNSGYRSYHYQVEAYISYRCGGNMAAYPTFAKGVNNPIKSTRTNANNAYAEAWIRKNCNYFTNKNDWNNVPEDLTSEGGILEGYGNSSHGWGLAIDINTDGEKHGRNSSKEIRWLSKHAEKYGFHPLLAKPSEFPDGSNNFEESWHWSFTG